MPFAQCIGGDPDQLCCASTTREIPAGRPKMRTLLGWPRPGTPTALGSNSQQSYHSDNNEAGKTTTERPATFVAPDSNNDTKEKRKPRLKSRSLDTQERPETAEDKRLATVQQLTPPPPPTRPGSRSVDSPQQSPRPRSQRCNSVDSRTSSTAASDSCASVSTLPAALASCSLSTGLEVETELLELAAPKVTIRKGEKSFLDFHQHYAITRHLGEGSYSTVKQVTHRQKGGFFACKIVDKLSLSAVDRSALAHEVRVLSSVSHPNIMRLYEVIEDDAKCYLVTELAEHGDLFDRIVKQGKFPEREAQKVCAALVEALHYCHARGVIHRDVKPENVLLTGDDVKLCDFGFARQLGDRDEQSTDSCGTPGYAAPEILDGRAYGLEVDVFSLGVVTYIMLCGYPPFPMKLAQLRTHRFNVRYPSKDWAAVPKDIKTLISKMLHVDPKLRPTMADLRAHAWVQAGRATLERLRREREERRRLADLTRRQQAASAIRKKLATGGFEAVKYGRNGMPHRTKLRLSADGKCLSWQPKLLKRGLLRYQNARSFTSLFGLSKDHGNSSSQPELHAPKQPQLNRGISTEASTVNQDASSCSHDANSNMSATAISATTPTDSTTSCSSSTSSTSDAINEKRLWWRSLRRERGPKTERTASGGITLNFTARQADSTPTSPAGTPALTTPRARSRMPSGVSESLVAATTGVAPSPGSPERLDDSIKLNDICELLVGPKAPFFAGHASNQPNTAKRAVDPACVLSVTTRFRELHLELPNEGVRDGFVYLIQQATLPLEQPSQYQPPRLVLSSSRSAASASAAADDEQPVTQQSNEQEAKAEAGEQQRSDSKREPSSRPEVDADDAETVASASNNQDE